MNKLIIFTLFILTIHLSAAQQSGILHARSSSEFKFTTWNTEWLSCATNGPTNEDLQMNNVAKVIKTLNSDIVALQEVGSSNIYATVDTLVKKLGSEWSGFILASWPDNCGQNEAVVYRKSKVQVINASLITDGGSSYDWSGGRYPVLYNINLIDGDQMIQVSLINIHAKAMGDETSYARRKNASAGLKALLDGSKYNAKNVVLLGDFNDYLIGTQCSSCDPQESPYKNFMDDKVNYLCLTSGIYDPNYNSPLIDNIIISNELSDNYIVSSVIREVSATQSVSNFYSTTSDHTPISARFSFSTSSTPDCQNINFSETFATGLGDFATYNTNGPQTWKWQAVYGATVSGYATGLNIVNEDWLISPAFDLSEKKTATLTFSHALNYAPLEIDRINNHTLWATIDYPAVAPGNAGWTQLPIPVMPSGNSWAYVNSGNIDIPPALMKKNLRFGFKYLSTETIAGTWEIKDLSFSTTCESAQVPVTDIRPNIIYALNNQIIIENIQAEAVIVYDITGRIIFNAPHVLKTEISVSNGGVYIVKAGNEVFKVMVY